MNDSTQKKEHSGGTMTKISDGCYLVVNGKRVDLPYTVKENDKLAIGFNSPGANTVYTYLFKKAPWWRFWDRSPDFTETQKKGKS